MLAEIPGFHTRARDLLGSDGPDDDLTLGQFDAGGFSLYFRTHFVLPLVAAVWSCPADTALEYPARYLFTFLANHGMLSISGSPPWHTVAGGSRSYVARMADRIPAVRTSAPARAVHRSPDAAMVRDASGGLTAFDAVVIATHADQALRLLAHPTPAEQKLLGAFQYTPNPAVLHTDRRVLPKSRRVRASWNYQLTDCHAGTAPDTGPRISYDMNRLQRLTAAEDYIVTLIGFGESYMAGDWGSPDLTGLLTVFAAQVGDLIPPWLQRLRRLGVRRHPAGDEPTPDGARHNIHRHYDLSNEMSALFLDETMTYSSALFPAGPDGLPRAADHLLAEAQRRKIDALLDRAGVGPGTRLLEIGTGWGELAIRAAARGARVVTVTISPERQALASRRVAGAGLSGQVRVELRDYREVDGEYDAICSSEMIEAVGEKYWPAYFAVLDRVLAPGGRVGLQAITMPHGRMLATRHTYTWIQKYIFPGGLIPSVPAIESTVAGNGSLRVAEREDFGAHYAETLRIWRERFAARADEVKQLGFDEVFIAMWTFYLCYAEAGFRAGYLDVSQLTPVKDK
jgi:cyclopropane-fatty-acyl-phospholipid synthase